MMVKTVFYVGESIEQRDLPTHIFTATSFSILKDRKGEGSTITAWHLVDSTLEELFEYVLDLKSEMFKRFRNVVLVEVVVR